MHWDLSPLGIPQILTGFLFATNHIAFATHPPVQTSSEIGGNQLNLLCNMLRYTPVELKTIFKIFKQWKTTFREEDLN